MTGGLISLLSLVCISLLVMTRLAEFLTPVVKKDMFVTSNMEVDPMINLNLDIVFPNAPCGVLDFKFQTGYSTWARADMTSFRFLEIDRVSGDVKAESPLVMDMVSQDKFKHIKE